MQRYSEEVIRYEALNDEGRPCEVLERITYERMQGEGAKPGELVVINRRFDLRTGEPLNRLSDTEFQQQESGARVQLRR